METNEVAITFETLFEILKKEKDTSDLQKLDEQFFQNVSNYLGEKQNLLTKDDGLFSDEEKKKAEKQLENAKRIVRELYERREKKVISVALLKSRTKTNVIDMGPLMETEKKFFEKLVYVLDADRSTVLETVLKGSVPGGISKPPPEPHGSMRLVRFLSSVPKFVGTELEEYGPFDQEDIANLPTEIADVLLSKGRVEEIKG